MLLILRLWKKKKILRLCVIVKPTGYYINHVDLINNCHLTNLYLLVKFIIVIFFMLVLLVEFIFLTTFYGLYHLKPDNLHPKDPCLEPGPWWVFSLCCGQELSSPVACLTSPTKYLFHFWTESPNSLVKIYSFSRDFHHK